MPSPNLAVTHVAAAQNQKEVTINDAVDALYQKVEAQSGCNACPAGYYQGSTGQSSCSSSCPSGKYSGSGASSCTSCSAGRYRSSSAGSSCTSCPAARMSSDRRLRRCRCLMRSSGVMSRNSIIPLIL